MKKQRQRKKGKKSSKKKTSASKKTSVVNAEVKSSQEKPVKEKPVKQKPVSSMPKKRAETGKARESSILMYFSKAGQFLRESKMELKKVKWPTRKELFASTAVVVVLTLIIAFYLGLVDFGLIKIIKSIVR